MTKIHKRLVKNAPFWLPGANLLLEWSVLAGIFCSFLVFLFYRGGNFVSPEAVGINSVIILFTSLAFGLWWYFQDSHRSYVPMAFIFMPWLTWLALDCFFISKSSVLASVRLGAWMQAVAVFAMIMHMGRSRKWLLKLLILVGIATLLMATVGVSQFNFRPGWVPGGGVRMAWTMGKASGPFMSPSGLAFMALMVMPVCLGVAYVRSFNIEARIACGAMAFVFFGAIVYTVFLPAIFILLGLLLVMPFFYSRMPYMRFRHLLVALVVMVVMSVLLGALDRSTREKFIALHEAKDPIPQTFSHSRALSQIFSHPFWGVGYGVTAVPMRAVAPFGDNPDIADVRGQYLQDFASHGAMALLFFAPVIWCFYRGWYKWKQLPFRKLSQEEEFRMRSPNAKVDERVSTLSVDDERKFSKHPVPTTKVLLLGVLSGLSAVFVVMLFVSPFENAALIYLMMVAMAVVWCLIQPEYKQAVIPQSGVIGLGASVLWTGMALSLSVPACMAQNLAYSAELRINAAKDPSIPLQRVLRMYFDSLSELRQSLDLEPRNAEAKALTAKLEFDLSRLLSSQSQSLRSHANQMIDDAIMDNSLNWYFRSIKITGMILDNVDAKKIETAYEEMLMIEQRSPMAWTNYASFLSTQKGRETDALKAVNSAIELVPDFAPALELKSIISISKSL